MVTPMGASRNSAFQDEVPQLPNLDGRAATAMYLQVHEDSVARAMR